MRTPRRLAWAVVLSVTATAFGQPVRVLHRAIPGDLPLEEAAQQAATPSSQPDALAQDARGTGWRENQSIDPALLRPRTSWETEPREMDRQTHAPPGTRLAYQEIFTPSVAPFKRVQAYDQVDELGRLSVRDPSLRPLAVNAPPPARWGSSRRGRFVGELNVELSPAWPTPVPGVAGEQRLVSYETASGQRVEFSQDSAGNLFARSTTAGTTRLTYVLEAPDSAFVSPPVPPTPLVQAAQQVPQAERPLAPSWLAERGGRVLAQVGVTPRTPFDSALSRLVGHFRAFRDAELPDTQQQGDLYTTLALGGVGACRHRAYALMPTLHALGIPARYVGNEAHAWVEVFVPDAGWTRVDLGGWEVPLDANAATDRPMYRPGNRDPFPTPAGYAGGYSQGTTLGGGTGGRTSVGAGEPPAESAQNGGQSGAAESNTSSENPGATQSGGGAGQSGGGSGQSGGSGASARGGTGRAEPTPSTPRATENAGDGVSEVRAPAQAASEREEERDDPEAPVQPVLSLGELEADEHAGFTAQQGFARGSMVHVRGRALDDRGAGVVGLVLELRLVRDRRGGTTLGTTVTGAEGVWDARVMLPPGLEGGDYELRAVSQRSGRFLGAVAQ